MTPIITIAKQELEKHSHSEPKIAAFAEKVSEMNHQNVYVSQTGIQLIEFICFLKDSGIHFEFFSNEEELKSVLSKPSA
jgi:hypothetical protein